MTAPWTGEELDNIRMWAQTHGSHDVDRWLATLDAARAEAARLRGALEAARATFHKLSGGVPDRVLAAELAAGRATINAARAATPAATATCKCPPELCACHRPSPAATAPDLLAGALREADRLHEARIRAASNPASDPTLADAWRDVIADQGFVPDPNYGPPPPDPARAVVEAAKKLVKAWTEGRKSMTIDDAIEWRGMRDIAEGELTAAVAALGRTT